MLGVRCQGAARIVVVIPTCILGIDILGPVIFCSVAVVGNGGYGVVFGIVFMNTIAAVVKVGCGSGACAASKLIISVIC